VVLLNRINSPGCAILTALSVPRIIASVASERMSMEHW
jgi:hypothetical protein